MAKVPRVRNRKEKSLKNNNNKKKKKERGAESFVGSRGPKVDNEWIPLLVEALYSPKKRAAAEAAKLSLSLGSITLEKKREKKRRETEDFHFRFSDIPQVN